MTDTGVDRPSLESLVENGMLPMESLHPGGLDITRQLVALCQIQRDGHVLDVACGTGETACLLAESHGARVVGIDRSNALLRRAFAKAGKRGLDVTFSPADAAHLPFADSTFDAVICECTLCFLDKVRVLGEMVRVTRPGGYVGMHDLSWREGAGDKLKRTLADIEGERPETAASWRGLFAEAGLEDIATVDKSDVMAHWVTDTRQQLGTAGYLGLMARVVRRWGLRGLLAILRSERVFVSQCLGYVIVVGRKPQ